MIFISKFVEFSFGIKGIPEPHYMYGFGVSFAEGAVDAFFEPGQLFVAFLAYDVLELAYKHWIVFVVIKVEVADFAIALKSL